MSGASPFAAGQVGWASCCALPGVLMGPLDQRDTKPAQFAPELQDGLLRP